MPGGELADPSLSPEVKRHRALGAPTRLRILELLGERPRSVSAVAVAVGVSVSAASRHLALLADAGLVRRERRGLRVICRRTEAVGAPPSDNADAGGLRAESVDDVQLYLGMGVSVMRFCGGRAEWDRRMAEMFGSEIRGHLPALHIASARLLNGESLDGLALPGGMRTEGLV